MTRGRSGDRTYTGHNGAREQALRDMDRGAKPVASVQERRHAPSPRVMRECIEQGICPFCGRQFQNLAGHTNRTHGVDRFELKELAGIPKSHPACSAEFSQDRSEATKRLENLPEVLARLHAAPRSPHRNYSPAGRAIQQAKLDRLHSLPPQLSDELRRKAAATNRQRHLAVTAERDAAIVAQINAGIPSEVVQQRFEVSPSVIKRALKRHGCDRDMRADAAQRSDRKDKAIATLSRGTRQAKQALKEQRLARWRELGSDWESLAVLATEWEVSELEVRSYLRTHGETVPDGRVVSPKRFRPRPVRLCEVPGCTRTHRTRGLCETHRGQWRKTTMTAEAFLAKLQGAARE